MPSLASVQGHPADRRVRSNNAVYLTARAGSTFALGSLGALDFFAGQEYSGDYRCWLFFLDFDIGSIIPLNAVATAVTFNMHAAASTIGENKTLDVRSYDWGHFVDTDEWIPGADFNGLTQLATIASGAYPGLAEGWYALTLTGTNLLGAINTAIPLGGLVSCAMSTTDFAAGTSPGGAAVDHRFKFSSSDSGYAPELIVTYRRDWAYTITDAIDGLDNPNDVDAAIRTVTEAEGITDAMSQLFTQSRSKTDALGIVDSESWVATYVRTIADGISVIDRGAATTLTKLTIPARRKATPRRIESIPYRATPLPGTKRA